MPFHRYRIYFAAKLNSTTRTQISFFLRTESINCNILRITSFIHSFSECSSVAFHLLSNEWPISLLRWPDSSWAAFCCRMEFDCTIQTWRKKRSRRIGWVNPIHTVGFGEWTQWRGISVISSRFSYSSVPCSMTAPERWKWDPQKILRDSRSRRKS